MNHCKNILLVEDDQAIRDEVRNILTDEGYHITCAKNGKEALDYLLSLPHDDLPGCMILDIMMPVMTGKELLEEMKKDEHRHLLTVPVIVATAKGSPKQDLIGFPETIQRIRKPFDLDQLLNAVEAHCGKPH